MKEKIALVTGGTSGIGKELAKQLLLSGCFVFINFGHNDKQMFETSEELKQISNNFEFIKADISNEEEVSRMMSIIKERFMVEHY